MEIRIGDFVGKAGPGYRQQTLELAGVYISQCERTKRLLIGAACFFLAVAALLVVFAPDDRETLANVCGVSLVVMALGSIGVTSFKLKLPWVNLDTTSDDTTPIENDKEQ